MTRTAMKIINTLIVLALIFSVACVVLLGLMVAQRPTISINYTDIKAQNRSLTIPITVANHGPLGLSNITGTVQLVDMNNTVIMQGQVGPASMPADSTLNFSVTLYFTDGLSTSALEALATGDQNLTLLSTMQAAVSPLSVITASISGNFDWGAPLESLNTGAPDLTSYADGYATLSVPFSFENHSPYINVSGMAQVTLTDSANNDVGSGSISVNAPSETSYEGELAINFAIPQNQPSLIFDDSNLTYTTNWQIPTNIFSLDVSEPLTIAWNAPVSGLRLGNFSIAPFNSTNSELQLAISFTDSSNFLALNGSVSGVVYDGNGDIVGSLDACPLNVPPDSMFIGNLSGYVDNSVSGPMTLMLTFSTPVGIGSQDFALG